MNNYSQWQLIAVLTELLETLKHIKVLKGKLFFLPNKNGLCVGLVALWLTKKINVFDEIENLYDAVDKWSDLGNADIFLNNLTKERVLEHIDILKNVFGIASKFCIAIDFAIGRLPLDSGIGVRGNRYTFKNQCRLIFESTITEIIHTKNDLERVLTTILESDPTKKILEDPSKGRLEFCFLGHIIGLRWDDNERIFLYDPNQPKGEDVVVRSDVRGLAHKIFTIAENLSDLLNAPASADSLLLGKTVEPHTSNNFVLQVNIFSAEVNIELQEKLKESLELLYRVRSSIFDLTQEASIFSSLSISTSSSLLGNLFNNMPDSFKLESGIEIIQKNVKGLIANVTCASYLVKVLEYIANRDENIQIQNLLAYFNSYLKNKYIFANKLNPAFIENLFYQDCSQMSLVIFAIENNDIETILFILNQVKNYKYNICGRYKENNLFLYAASCGSQSIVNAFLIRGVNSDSLNNQFSAVDVAAAFGWDRILSFLIDKKATIEDSDDKMSNTLKLAIFSGNERSVEILLQHSDIASLSSEHVIKELFMFGTMLIHTDLLEKLSEKIISQKRLFNYFKLSSSSTSLSAVPNAPIIVLQRMILDKITKLAQLDTLNTKEKEAIITLIIKLGDTNSALHNLLYRSGYLTDIIQTINGVCDRNPELHTIFRDARLGIASTTSSLSSSTLS